jgi:hypothetical protein
MPELLPKVMDNLMPHMIGKAVPLVTQPMIDYLRGKKPDERLLSEEIAEPSNPSPFLSKRRGRGISSRTGLYQISHHQLARDALTPEHLIYIRRLYFSH